MKFRKKPVVIEAEQFTMESKDRMLSWVDGNRYGAFINDNPVLIIQTLEGDMTVSIGDWVIRGVNGEFYPCKPDIFEKTYEKVW